MADEELPPSFTNASATLLDSLFGRALSTAHQLLQPNQVPVCIICSFILCMQYRSPPAYAPCAHCQCSLQELVSLYQSKENAIHEFDRAVDTRHQMYLEQLQEIAIQVRKVLKTLVPQFYAPLDQLAPDISVRSVSGTHGRVQ